ncbi:MAG TPA: amidase [Gammaproteobacteria bacterium]|nr:amidase [Gammaproteobacteria bacterium]
MDLHKLGTVEILSGLRIRSFSVVELVQTLLERISALDYLQAWVCVDPEGVVEQARQKQAELDAGSSAPLIGVPTGVKDIFYTAGVPTTACSKVYADFVPKHDATTVARLQQAGGIMLGKTVTTEFAYRDPSPTRNPWNTDHTPGGSSSGSAAAVAAMMCPTAFGSQTRGSVLRPASYNGIVGLKPTFGRVSRFGVVPLSWSFDHVGWMARSVEDVALMLQVMAGPDKNDPTTVQGEVPDYCVGLKNPDPPHVGVLEDYFLENADDDVRAHTQEVVERLARDGARIEHLALPESFERAMADQLTILTVEAANFHEPLLKEKADLYGPNIRELVETGLGIDAVTYSRALESRLQLIADAEALAKKAQVLLTPTTPTPAPGDLSVTGSAMFQGPWTSTGLPTVTVPSGLSQSGLPLGIQLITARLEEPRLLSAAKWCEQVLGRMPAPPLQI